MTVVKSNKSITFAFNFSLRYANASKDNVTVEIIKKVFPFRSSNRLGYLVGRHPWFTIGLCLLLIVTLGGGLFFWVEEHDSVALWSTYDSVARRNSEWVNQHFSDDVRYESVIVAAEHNILRPDVLVLVSKSVFQF